MSRRVLLLVYSARADRGVRAELHNPGGLHAMAITAEARHGPSATADAGVVTVATLARDWARRAPHQVAMREKDLGIWQEYTWDRVWNDVLDAAHALLALGVEPGDRVSIHSEDRPEWVILDIATVAVRAITVGLYPTNPAAEVEYLLGDSGATVHLAEDQEQVDKVFASPDTGVGLRRSSTSSPVGSPPTTTTASSRGTTSSSSAASTAPPTPAPSSERMAEATRRRRDHARLHVGHDRTAEGGDAHQRQLRLRRRLLVRQPERLPDGKAPGPDDLVVTYLPLCHVAERIFSTWHLVGAGVVLNFAESIDTVTANLREVQPTLFFAVPRIWEKLHAGVLIKGNDASRFKRIVFRRGLRAAAKIGRAKVANGGNHTTASRLRYAFWYPLVFRPLKERIGLRRCRHASSGAAPIAPEVLEFFMGIGVPVFELYGMTENTAIGSLNLPGPGEARHRRRAVPRHRAAPRPGDQRDPDAPRRHVRRLLGQAGQDRRDVHRRRLPVHRRRRRVGRRHPPAHRRPHQAHHHHVGRQERVAVGDRERAEDVAVRQGGDGRRRRSQVPARP